MRGSKNLLLLCIFVFAAVPAGQAMAAWPADGVPACVSTGDQEYPKAVSDGAGGLIMVWEDSRGGGLDIYAQSIDASGTPRWTLNGREVCTASGDQEGLDVVSDGAGGVIIVWKDYRSSADYDIYAQRIDASGLAVWNKNGVAICTASGDQEYAGLAADGSGGALIAWHDYRSGSSDVYAQRVNLSGSGLWAPGGVPVCTASGDTYYLDIVSDEAGGAFITWQDSRDGLYKIFAQRIASGGSAAWTVDGIPMNSYSSSQTHPAAETDGNGGMIVAWRDLRNGAYYDIYAQKVDPNGFILWESGGVEIRAVSGSHIVNQLITPDGEGGAFVGWTDSRGSDNDIYMQRILDKGAVYWAADGITVCDFPGGQWLNSMAPDGSGGVIASWVDYRGTAGNVYSQKIDGEGIGSWETGGVAVCPSEERQDYIDVIPDGNGGMISCWTDFRNPDEDIYAQMTDFMGRSGYLPPVIRSVSDIPGDQGGTVRVLWDSSPLDHMSGEITRYTVWRSIETAEAMKIIESGGRLLTSPGELPISEQEIGDPLLRPEQLSAADYYWEFVTDVDASYFENYAATAETYFDSTATCDDFHYFQVVAHTSSPAVFWVSEVDSGYSVDNLAPAMPLNLAVAQSYSPIGLWLSWDPNNEYDLGGYNIYRGTSSSFTPGPEDLINSTTQTVVFDEQWTWESGYWYKVAAYDIHGNLSKFAILGPDMISGDTSGPVPGAAFLAQNWPNPFNPSTTIEFCLKSDGHVSLKIYDAAGRLVRKLIDGQMEAGTQAVVWNGLSDGGNRVSSGVYFYRIRTGEFEATRKMVLMK